MKSHLKHIMMACIIAMSAASAQALTYWVCVEHDTIGSHTCNAPENGNCSGAACTWIMRAEQCDPTSSWNICGYWPAVGGKCDKVWMDVGGYCRLDWTGINCGCALI